METKREQRHIDQEVFELHAGQAAVYQERIDELDREIVGKKVNGYMVVEGIEAAFDLIDKQEEVAELKNELKRIGEELLDLGVPAGIYIRYKRNGARPVELLVKEKNPDQPLVVRFRH